MTECPICETKMKKKKVEYRSGMYINAEVCPNCGDSWLDKKGYKRLHGLFRRKMFNAGGSLEVRIPKEIADALHLKTGQTVNFSVEEKKVIIEIP